MLPFSRYSLNCPPVTHHSAGMPGCAALKNIIVLVLTSGVAQTTAHTDCAGAACDVLEQQIISVPEDKDFAVVAHHSMVRAVRGFA